MELHDCNHTWRQFCSEGSDGDMQSTSPKTEVSLPLGESPNVRVKKKEPPISPLSRAIFGFTLVLPMYAGVFMGV